MRSNQFVVARIDGNRIAFRSYDASAVRQEGRATELGLERFDMETPRFMGVGGPIAGEVVFRVINGAERFGVVALCD